VVAEELVKPFSFYVPIEKAAASADGKTWIVEGPLTEPTADLEGDEMDCSQEFEKGLEEGFDRLGQIVDHEHLYERTLDDNYIMGYGIERYRAPHPQSGVDVPWLRTNLLKGTKWADQMVDGLAHGRKYGYSVAGCVKKRLGSKVVPFISTVGITARPIQSRNVGTIAFAKALRSDLPFEEIQFPIIPELVSELPCIKAITASAALPHVGPTVSALGVEQIEGHCEEGQAAKKKRRKPTPVQKALGALWADRIDALIEAAERAA